MIHNRMVSTDRIALDLEALARTTDPDRPWTRRAFTPRFASGRDYLTKKFREAGLTTAIDAAGNLVGECPGSDPSLGTIMLGSHSDTVPDGGRFDGVAGVVAALEVARALRDRGTRLRHNLAVVDFLAEEVSIFGVSCIGSRALAGVMPQNWLSRTAADGRALAQAMTEVGADPEALGAPLRNDLAAFLELHIEQGPVLEEIGDDIGVVSAIAGITRVEVVVSGRPDHAGTTPMNRRADALVAAAALVTEIADKASELSRMGNHFTATVGELALSPGAANVVPGEVALLIDARAELASDMARFLEWLENRVAPNRIQSKARRISENPPVPLNSDVVHLLETAAEQVGACHRKMVSGAGHDAAFMARLCPSAMVFVPCRGGRSHCPEEETSYEEIALGAEVMAEAVLALDSLERDIE